MVVKQARTNKTRLERHRASWELGRRTGPLLRLEDLDQSEVELINADFFVRARDLGANDLERMYEVYVETLHMWGVMCPHPLYQRLYDGWRRSELAVPTEESRWFSCGLCKTLVINHDT